MFSKKATKIDEIFTVDLKLYSKCQINGEDFVIFCGLLRKHEHYIKFASRVKKCSEIVNLACSFNRYLETLQPDLSKGVEQAW